MHPHPDPLAAPHWLALLPFCLMLLAVAVLPLVWPHGWEHNRNRLAVAAALGLPIVVWAALTAPELLQHTLAEYLTFVVLMGSLYSITGGLVLRGELSGRPLSNLGLLLLGSGLASLIGTTGASMLLIRPLLRATVWRRHRAMPVVFFIFMVSNIGGLLTPLGDPPLFLGFLRGVPFFWPLRLWRPWAVALGSLAIVFFLLDSLALRREPARPPSSTARTPLRLGGGQNLLALATLLAMVVLAGHQAWSLAQQMSAMLTVAALAWRATPASLRRENEFSWGPMLEVAIIFAGIFATMMPALQILGARGATLGLTQPRQFFWVTGLLSSFLDNAPTYLALSATASALLGTAPQALQTLLAAPTGPDLLAAISMGAVMMGANTYLGNGPNLMVLALAEARGVAMPSFAGYLLWSASILLPLFAVLTWLFF